MIGKFKKFINEKNELSSFHFGKLIEVFIQAQNQEVIVRFQS